MGAVVVERAVAAVDIGETQAPFANGDGGDTPLAQLVEVESLVPAVRAGRHLNRFG